METQNIQISIEWALSITYWLTFCGKKTHTYPIKHIIKTYTWTTWPILVLPTTSSRKIPRNVNIFWQGWQLPTLMWLGNAAIARFWMHQVGQMGMRKIGYMFIPRKHQEGVLQDTFDEALDTFYIESRVFPSEEVGYFGHGVAGVFNFHKYHPDHKIQLITALHSLIEVILNFHSSGSYSPSLWWHCIWHPDYSLHHEYYHTWLCICFISNCNIWAAMIPHLCHERLQAGQSHSKIHCARVDYGNFSAATWDW